MEPLPTDHLIPPTVSQEQKLINRETSVVEIGLAPADYPVGRDESRRFSPDARAPSAPTPPAIVATSPPSFALAHSSSIQPYLPTQAVIDQHPIRQRLSLSGEHVAASGWGTKKQESESPGIGRQENIEAVEGAKESKMTEVKEGDKGM